jgi:carbonic anhydrase/acetyltransferase-like protein (isoleucine patch superfamily)
MGAIVLNGAVVERGALVAAGALVPEGARIPAGHLAVGVPARVLRPLSDAERARMERGLRVYLERARLYRERLGSGA